MNGFDRGVGILILISSSRDRRGILMTIYQAAASPSALVFMIIFIGFLIPIMLFYNIYPYVVFRGKVTSRVYGESLRLALIWAASLPRPC